MPDLTLTYGQNGGRFTVHVGDAIHVHLSENASTGYRWSVVSLDHARLEMRSEEYHAAGAAVGSGGTAAWTFHAKQAGPVRIELVKSRSWETAKAADRFAVELTIEP